MSLSYSDFLFAPIVQWGNRSCCVHNSRRWEIRHFRPTCVRVTKSEVEVIKIHKNSQHFSYRLRCRLPWWKYVIWRSGAWENISAVIFPTQKPGFTTSELYLNTASLLLQIQTIQTCLLPTTASWRVHATWLFFSATFCFTLLKDLSPDLEKP